MATKAEIKSYIKSRVKTNSTHDITGDHLADTLCKIIDDLDTSGVVSKEYVDQQDTSTLSRSNQYTSEGLQDLRTQVDQLVDDSLTTAKGYADQLVEGLDNLAVIDASEDTAYDKALEAYQQGKALMVKCNNYNIVPMTAVADELSSVPSLFQGSTISYTGLNIGQNLTVSTTLWTLSSNGIVSQTRDVPAYSCRTIDLVKSSYTLQTAFAFALDEYKKGYSLILKIDENTSVLASSVNDSAILGYTFTFNQGTLEDGQVGIVSIDIIRWKFTPAGVSRDTFNTSSSGGGGGGSVTLIQSYSTKDVTEGVLPQNPDDDPSFWNQSEQTSASIWAAIKSTGSNWSIWRVQPKGGTGIVSMTQRYGVSDSGSQKPSNWSETMPAAQKGQYIWCEVTVTYTTGKIDVYYTVSYIGTDGEDGISPNTSFKSFIFTRQNTPPDTPQGGSYDNPFPDDLSWTDGIPDGEEKLWASTRIFSSDGKDPQQASWTEPQPMTDTSDFDVEFSSEENPDPPQSHPNVNSQWSNTSDSTTIWMATSVKRNGEWSKWTISRIKGERGEDGTSIKIKGTLNSTSELPVPPEDASDCYIIGYDLYVWDGDSWVNAGPFKGQDGEDGKSTYVHIKYANSTVPNDWTANNGETPGRYIGIYVDTKAADSTVWSDYKWSKWEGQDGFGYEYIYQRTSTNIAPSTPTQVSQEDGFVPSGWTDDPSGVNSEYPYEWVCYRKSTGGKWGSFRGSNSDVTKAALWAKYSFDGQDGDPGASGESSLVVDLDNEIEACALTHEGLTPFSHSITTNVSAYYGLTKLSIDRIVTSLVGTDKAQVNSSSTGVITVSWGAGVALNTFSVVIGVTVTVKGTSYTREVTFTVNCIKAGAPGEDAVLYKLRPSASNIFKYVDGSYSTASISCQKLKVQGNKIEETQDGVLSYSIDGASSKTYTGPIASSSISKKIRFEYRVNSLLWDAEDVFIMEDGKTLTVTKTEYKYALTMGHTVPADDAWSDTPVAGLPGQYLWVKTIYTWSDGSTTYSLSYARCGSDGANGTGADGKTSVTLFRGTWIPEGKYTGTIDGNVMRADIVYYKAAGEVDGKYYMALATKGFVDSTTPAPNTTAGKSYWGEFQGQYANIATGLLFTEKAIIENATVRSLKTADEGARIETQGNQLASYDDEGVQRISLDPEGEKPFSILPETNGSPLNSRGFYGITIPSQLGGKSYTGGKLVIDSYQGTDAQLAEDAKMVAIMTGCTLAEATLALENDTSINIQVNNSEANLRNYISANAKGTFNFASRSYETANTKKLYIGWDADGQGALEVGTQTWYATVAENVVLGSDASIINPTAAALKDRYSFNSKSVNLAFLPNLTGEMSLWIYNSSNLTSGKITGVSGWIYGHLVLVNKTTNEEIVFMNLIHDNSPSSEGGLDLNTLFSNYEYYCFLNHITTSGTKLPETGIGNTPREVPEIPLGIYDIKIKFTTKVENVGTGWSSLGAQGISFILSITDVDDRDGSLQLRVYPQSRALSFNSQGISVVRSAQEYFQLGFKSISDQSDDNLDLEAVMGDNILKMNSLESYFGPRDQYGKPHGNFYYVIDISAHENDLSTVTVDYPITLIQKFPIFLKTWLGFIPLVICHNSDSRIVGLSASILTGEVTNTGISNLVNHFFFISPAGKVSYFPHSS